MAHLRRYFFWCKKLVRSYCAVQRTIRRIAIGSLGNSFDDARDYRIRRVLTVRHARSTQVVFRIGADAHRRKLVLPVNHFVQSLCKTRRAAPGKDHMGNGIHRHVPVASRLFPDL